MCIQMHTHVYLVVLAIALEIRNKAPWSWRSYERRWKREYTKIKWKKKIKQNTETHQVRKMHLVVYIHAWRVRPVARWCIVSAAPSRAKKKCIFFFCCVYGCTTPRQRTPMHTYTLYAQHIIISSTNAQRAHTITTTMTMTMKMREREQEKCLASAVVLRLVSVSIYLSILDYRIYRIKQCIELPWINCFFSHQRMLVSCRHRECNISCLLERVCVCVVRIGIFSERQQQQKYT